MKLTIEEFKKKLKGLSKEEKILAIKQELNNREFARMSIPIGRGSALEAIHVEKKKEVVVYSPTDEQLKELQREVENNVEAYESETLRKELIPFMCDYDMNWYYNKKNIANFKGVVEPTVDFLEIIRPGVFETIDFLNLVQWHYVELQKQFEKPFNFIKHLRDLPLSMAEKHLLIAALLQWYGGIPVENEYDKLFTIRRLVEKEFLGMFPETDTLEKRFCSGDYKSIMQLKEEENEESKNVDVLISKGKVYKVEFDFGELPLYVSVELRRIFDQGIMKGNESYERWIEYLKKFLSTIPEQKKLAALTKGIDYGQMRFDFYLKHECKDRLSSPYAESWERRLALAEGLLNELQPQMIEPEVENETEPENVNKAEFTTARQVLAVHYLLEYCQVRNVDNTAKARFIQFLTGKQTNAKSIKNTEIYQRVRSPLGKDDTLLTKDLQFVRKYFEDLGLSEVAKAITNEISKREM